MKLSLIKIRTIILISVVTLSSVCYGTSLPDSIKAKDRLTSLVSKLHKLQNIGIRHFSDEELLNAAEKTARRLKEEHWKIQIIFSETDKLINGLKDLRDIQLYPSSLTKADKKWAAKLDKKLEKREKEINKMRAKVDKLYRPLLDAIAIMKEMASSEIDMDMLEMLQKENRERVKTILRLKRDINEQWTLINRYFDDIAGRIGLHYANNNSTRGFDAEFFDILYSNLGKSSDLFFEKVRQYKDTLASRGASDTWKEMASIDMARVRQRINDGQYKISARDLRCLTTRFSGKMEIGGLYYLYGKTLMALERYREAYEAFSSIDSLSTYFSQSKLRQMETLFLLENFKGVSTCYSNWLNVDTGGVEHNFAVLLAVLSAYRLEEDDSVIVYVSAAKPGQKYYTEILYTMAQVYLRKGDIVTSRKIFEKALNTQESEQGEKNTRYRIILSQGHLLYEQGRYKEAIEKFFNAMKSPDFFAESLYGIVWSYLKSGHINEAEITLRKLINQNPDHYLAVEGILLLARKMAARAELEWKYWKFCEKEKNWIDRFSKTFEKRKKEGFLSKRQLSDTKESLDSLRHIQSKRKPLSIKQIVKLYNMAMQTCKMIPENYQSGFYLERSITGRREQMINKLSELYMTIQARKKKLSLDKINVLENKKLSRVASVKEAVRKSHLFKIKLLIRRRNWEKEYSYQYLTALNKKLVILRKETNTVKDSVVRVNAQKNIDQLIKARDNFVDVTEQEKFVRRNQIIKNIESFRKGYNFVGKEEEYVLYQQGELYYEAQRDKYIKGLEQYDIKLAYFDSLKELFDAKKIKQRPEQPKQPKLNYDKIISICNYLIERYPNGRYADGIFYLLGYCYSDLGTEDKARKQFETICRRFPGSPYISQSYMILGEYCFDNSELKKAVSYYTSVLKYPESEWFDEAIYKLGWTYYRLSKTKKAISSFMYLMADNKLSIGAGGKKSRSLLEKESIDYIAISFAEEEIDRNNVVEKAKAFIDQINDELKGARIMHKLARVYLAQGTDRSLKLAREAFRTILKMFPKYKFSSQVELEIVKTYEKQANMNKANQIRMEIFRKYNKDGSWVKSITDKSVIAFSDSIARTALYDLANNYMLEAAQRSNVALYEKAMQAYRMYVNKYKDDSRTAECHYNIAETLFSLGNYYKAAEEYIKVSRLYNKDAHQENAAWNAIVSAQNYIKSVKRKK